MFVISACSGDSTSPAGPSSTATASDFVGTWNGSVTVEGESRTTTLTLDNNLSGSYVVVGSSRTDTYGNISASVSNGTLSFSLPVSDLDVGNPDCANWSMQSMATLDSSSTTMTLSATGTTCGPGGGQPGSFSDTLTKQ